MTISDSDAIEMLFEAADESGYWRPRAASGDFDAFCVALRSDELGVGKWNDRLGIIWHEQGRFRIIWREGTTDPGREGAKTDHPKLHRDGTGVACAGQYRAALGWGRYRQKRALRQRGPIACYRDKVIDGRVQLGGEMHQILGAHRHGPWKDDLQTVGLASLGCRVTRRMNDHLEMMDVAAEQVRRRGWTVFTETLFQVSGPPIAHPKLAPLLQVRF